MINHIKLFISIGILSLCLSFCLARAQNVVSSDENPRISLSNVDSLDPECSALSSERDTSLLSAWEKQRGRLQIYKEIVFTLDRARSEAKSTSQSFERWQIVGVVSHTLVIATGLVDDLLGFVSGPDLQDMVTKLQKARITNAKRTYKIATNVSNDKDLAAVGLEIAFDTAMKNASPIGRGAITIKNFAKNSVAMTKFISQSGELQGELKKQIDDLQDRLSSYSVLQMEIEAAFQDLNIKKNKIDERCGLQSARKQQEEKAAVKNSSNYCAVAEGEVKPLISAGKYEEAKTIIAAASSDCPSLIADVMVAFSQGAVSSNSNEFYAAMSAAAQGRARSGSTASGNDIDSDGGRQLIGDVINFSINSIINKRAGGVVPISPFPGSNGNTVQSASTSSVRGGGGDCADYRSSIAQVNQMISEAERMSRSTTTNGGLNTRYDPSLDNFRKIKREIEAKGLEMNCR